MQVRVRVRHVGELGLPVPPAYQTRPWLVTAEWPGRVECLWSARKHRQAKKFAKILR